MLANNAYGTGKRAEYDQKVRVLSRTSLGAVYVDNVEPPFICHTGIPPVLVGYITQVKLLTFSVQVVGLIRQGFSFIAIYSQ